MKYPKMRHPYCQIHHCKICFQDHIELGDFLANQDGVPKNEIDFLCRYHNWCSDNGINAETDFGWATPESFLPENIDKFVEFLKEERGIASDE